MAVPTGVDPREVLGVPAGAAPSDVTAAYRRLAKRWHPDRAGGATAADRMALINAAYAELRAGVDAPARAAPRTQGRRGPRQTPPTWWGPGEGRAGEAPRPAHGGDGAAPAPGTGADPAADLDVAVRRALGAELRAALEPGEDVGLVVPVATWASPQATLAVTDRRLLWLLDDAPVHRVRELPLADVVTVQVRPPRLLRRLAEVVCVDRRGTRTAFGELEEPTATAVARRVRRRSR